MEPITQFRLGELFSGPGGLAYGAMSARIENLDYRILHQWATDYDTDTCATYEHNICNGKKNIKGKIELINNNL